MILSTKLWPAVYQENVGLENDEEPLPKRCKTSPPSLNDQACVSINKFEMSPSKYDPLEEPSPLGLRLKKSPSLLNLIQMKLSEEGNKASVTASLNGYPKYRKKNKMSAHSMDKMKASNFPVLHLRIGGWKYESRHEGDIVAKFYYSKHKIVWEVLDKGLKKKIEIQWPDIISLKAICPEKGPGTLTIMLGRQPSFFSETNPLPRRQILWQETADFTGGQAINYRMHTLQCPEGVLNKHYDKLIQCDSRLKLLSQQSDTDLPSLDFVTQPYGYKDQVELRNFNFSSPATTKGRSPLSGIMSPTPSQPSSSVSTSLGNGDYDFHGLKNWEPLNKPEIQPHKLSSHANYMGHGIPYQTTSGNQLIFEKGKESMINELGNIAEILLGDTEMKIEGSNEQALMKRVNSLCCLLQDHPEKANEDRKIEGERSQLDVLFGNGQLIEASNEKSLMMSVSSLCSLLQGVHGQNCHFQEGHNVKFRT